MEKESTLQSIKNFLYSFIFDLPFQHYHDFYKTGKIQKMSKEEKINLLMEMSKKKQHNDFFRRLLMLRPTFLDDEDLLDYKETSHQVKRYRGAIIGSFFLNWTYFVFNFFVKKRMVLKSFLLLNGVITVCYVKTNTMMNNFQNKLFNKYKHILKKDDLEKLMKNSYRID